MNKIKQFFKNNWVLIFAILYLILPADLLPDILPVLGKLDDTSIFVIELARRLMTQTKNEQE